MGATESSYRKLGATVAKLQCVPRKKVDETEDRVVDRKGKKRRRESLFANAQWSSGSRRRGSDVSEWPAWYHGWCRFFFQKRIFYRCLIKK